MNRKKFLGLAGGAIVIVGATYYLTSDRHNFVRAETLEEGETIKSVLNYDEQHILHLGAMAPSGHNTQPWFIQHISPLVWIVCTFPGC